MAIRAMAKVLGLLPLSLLLVTGPASAGDHDFRLNGTTRGGDGIMFTQNPDGTYQALTDPWNNFATQLGYVFCPRLASPAETLGHSGFHVGAMWSSTFISDDETYWQVTDRGQRSGDPTSFLQTLQFDVRKGLPFSFEVGVNFMWLIDSELFAPGLEVRWALQEGYAYTPDFAVRGSVNHMVGNRDMNLTTIGIDAVLSKGFGIGGMVHIAPYLSWSFIMVAATSRVLDPTPTVEDDIANNLVLAKISPTSELHHKLTIGVRTVYYVLNLSVQGEFQMLEGQFIGPVGTITTKLGLDF